jgi:hypothetical protein
MGKKKGRRFVIMNGKYFTYDIALCSATITLQNAAQYYGWYMNNSTMTDRNGGLERICAHSVAPISQKEGKVNRHKYFFQAINPKSLNA